MKALALMTLALLTLSTVEAKLPAEIAKLSGRTGSLSVSYNGKTSERDQGSDCKIEESEYSEGSVVIHSTLPMPTTAHLDDAKRSEKNGVVTYVTTSTGKRPGGSVCDMGPLTSYTKSVIVTKNSVTIKEKFACAIFDRNEILLTCTIK